MPPAARLILIIAAINGLLAVAFGAFGAHALRARVSESLLSAWQTGVQYQFYHALALLAVGVLLTKNLNHSLLITCGVLFAVGIVLFSGSLYGLTLGGPKWLGPVTPAGGMLLIFGWAVFIAAIIRG